MVKIDFEKVEKNIGDAQHNWFIKKLASQQPSSYPRASAYFGLDVAKPGPQDSVIGAIVDWRQDLLEEEIEQKKQKQAKALEVPELAHTAETLAIEKESKETPITIDTEELVKEEVIETGKPQVQEEPMFQDAPSPTVAPIYILRKRLLWFARKRVTNIYKLLGTTKEEVITLRKKKNRTAEDDKRIDELLQKSHEINERLRKKLGFSTDEDLIEKEKKRHITKRFNIRETWLPL